MNGIKAQLQNKFLLSRDLLLESASISSRH